MKPEVRTGILLMALGLTILASPDSMAQRDKETEAVINVRRLEGNPIVKPNHGPRIGTNVQGPSLIRVPEWLPNPLGKYYLYFADHKGSYIRLAYADALSGPWKIYDPGTLQLEQSHFLTEPAKIPERVREEVARGGWKPGPVEGTPTPLETSTKPHIASPDVHVRDDRREIVMYYHGLEDFQVQRTRVATSKDGIHFEARKPLLANSYTRAFWHDGQWYSMAMPGIFSRSKDGLSNFEANALRLFPNIMRHCALLKRGDTLYVFWTQKGDTPEHILLTTVDMSGDWSTWSASETVSVLRPEEDWEGADRPLVPSVGDAINVRVNQLRDPAIFEEDDRVYLLYAVAGESGIAIAEIKIP